MAATISTTIFIILFSIFNTFKLFNLASLWILWSCAHRNETKVLFPEFDKFDIYYTSATRVDKLTGYPDLVMVENSKNLHSICLIFKFQQTRDGLGGG